LECERKLRAHPAVAVTVEPVPQANGMNSKRLGTRGSAALKLISLSEIPCEGIVRLVQERRVFASSVAAASVGITSSRASSQALHSIVSYQIDAERIAKRPLGTSADPFLVILGRML